MLQRLRLASVLTLLPFFLFACNPETRGSLPESDSTKSPPAVDTPTLPPDPPTTPPSTVSPARPQLTPTPKPTGLGRSFAEMRRIYEPKGYLLWHTDDGGLAAISPRSGVSFELDGPSHNFTRGVILFDGVLDATEEGQVVGLVILLTNGEMDGVLQMILDVRSGRDDRLSRLIGPRRVTVENFFQIGYAITVESR